MENTIIKSINLFSHIKNDDVFKILEPKVNHFQSKQLSQKEEVFPKSSKTYDI